jgi:hypothetical protein
MFNLDKEGRWADCPSEPICHYACNPSCPQYPAKAGNSNIGETRLVQPLDKEMKSEEVLSLWRDGKLWLRTDGVRKCAVCGRVVTGGLVWDGTTTFCSEACAASVFDGDEGCVNILIDAGRIELKEGFDND